MVDMADAIMAQRAYEANLALVNISKSMAAKAEGVRIIGSYAKF